MWWHKDRRQVVVRVPDVPTPPDPKRPPRHSYHPTWAAIVVYLWLVAAVCSVVALDAVGKQPHPAPQLGWIIPGPLPTWRDFDWR